MTPQSSDSFSHNGFIFFFLWIKSFVMSQSISMLHFLLCILLNFFGIQKKKAPCLSQLSYIYSRLLFHIHHEGCYRVLTSAESWSTIHLYIFLQSQPSAPVSHQSVSLDVLLELCQLQTFFCERMGGVRCSFTQECNTIGEAACSSVCGAFSRLFFLHLVCGRKAFPW